MLLVALGALMASTVLFMLADSAAWLFVARGLQGLATGAALGAASAALLDLHPRRDPAAVGLANGVASAGGIGLGILVSSSLVQLGDAPRVAPYVVLFVLFAIAFVGVYLMPEPVAERAGFRLTVQRPSVPPPSRRPFVLAGLAVLSSWSIGGLFFSLGPQLSAELFDSTNVIVSSIGIVALAAVGGAGPAGLRPDAALDRRQRRLGRARGRRAADRRWPPTPSRAPPYIAGSIVGGIGFGVAFLGGLRALAASIPPGHRAAVMSAFYIAAYASLSVPAVLAGLVVDDLGLERTFETFGMRRRGPRAGRRVRGLAHPPGPPRGPRGAGRRRGPEPERPGLAVGEPGASFLLPVDADERAALVGRAVTEADRPR